jgi:hypothetical protein
MICVFYAQTVWPSTLPHTNGLACNFYAHTVWPPTKLGTHQRVEEKEEQHRDIQKRQHRNIQKRLDHHDDGL